MTWEFKLDPNADRRLGERIGGGWKGSAREPTERVVEEARRSWSTEAEAESLRASDEEREIDETMEPPS